VNEFSGEPFTYVITVCDQARESCPAFPGVVQQFHWSIADPAAAAGDPRQRLAAFRAARDELRQVLRHFGMDAHALRRPAH
jgi:arsenate reductase (thioredoxin)